MATAEMDFIFSRSVISRHLKDLQIRLDGLRLCSRGRAGFALKPGGRKVNNAIQQLNLAIDSFRSEINDIHCTMTGNLIIAIGDLTMANPNANIAEEIRRFTETD